MAREETRESHTRAAMAKRSNWRLHSIKGPHWGGVCRSVTHFPGPLPSSDESRADSSHS